MHQELIDELLRFARENNLRFKYGLNDQSGYYYFTFQDQRQTWGYCQEISMEQLDLFNGPTVCFARKIIEDFKRRYNVGT